MFTGIVAILTTVFPTIASWINLVIGYFQNQAAQQTTQNQAVQNAVTAHNNDGAQSVADMTSTDAQNAALTTLEGQLDGPSQVIVVPPPTTSGKS